VVTLLYSIEELDPANIIDTMNRPIIVHASDLYHYYCKYHRLHGQAYRLYKEFLIASFLSHWNFHSSPVNLIQVKAEHIPTNLGIRRSDFAYPCFGLQKIASGTELDKHNSDILISRKISPRFRSDFLRLAFFDIWLANEDRSHNNYNVLLSAVEGRYELFPIDHEACFNHNVLTGPLTLLTFEDSLIYSEAFERLFRPKDITPEAIVGLRESCYLYVGACQKNIDLILASVPPAWGIDQAAQKTLLTQFLFTDQWFREAWQEFCTFLHRFLR